MNWSKGVRKLTTLKLDEFVKQCRDRICETNKLLAKSVKDVKSQQWIVWKRQLPSPLEQQRRFSSHKSCASALTWPHCPNGSSGPNFLLKLHRFHLNDFCNSLYNHFESTSQLAPPWPSYSSVANNSLKSWGRFFALRINLSTRRICISCSTRPGGNETPQGSSEGYS